MKATETISYRHCLNGKPELRKREGRFGVNNMRSAWDPYETWCTRVRAAQTNGALSVPTAQTLPVRKRHRWREPTPEAPTFGWARLRRVIRLFHFWRAF